jgi:phosphate acetyltransferase
LALSTVRFRVLFEAADRIGDKRLSIFFPEGDDSRVAAAASRMVSAGWASAVLMTRQRRSPTLGAHGLKTLPRADVFDQMAPSLTAAVPDEQLAAQLTAAGHFDGTVIGATTHSRDVISAGLAHLHGPGSGHRVAGGAWIETLERHDRPMVFVDPSVNVSPDARTLADGLTGAAALYRAITGHDPYIGLVSWNTGREKSSCEVHGYVGLTEELTSRGLKVVAPGPAQLDALMHRDVAARKGLLTDHWAPVDVVGFPSLESANIGTKIAEFVGGASTSTFTTGFDKPFNDVSRSASVDAILAAAAMTIIQCSAHAQA